MPNRGRGIRLHWWVSLLRNCVAIQGSCKCDEFIGLCFLVAEPWQRGSWLDMADCDRSGVLMSCDLASRFVLAGPGPDLRLRGSADCVQAGERT